MLALNKDGRTVRLIGVRTASIDASQCSDTGAKCADSQQVGLGISCTRRTRCNRELGYLLRQNKPIEPESLAAIGRRDARPLAMVLLRCRRLRSHRRVMPPRERTGAAHALNGMHGA